MYVEWQQMKSTRKQVFLKIFGVRPERAIANKMRGFLDFAAAPLRSE
jgi:hypothetical protein